MASKKFLDYYLEEILFLRERGKVFARKFPEVAAKLDIHGGMSNDPHSERLIESFAFLSAQLMSKIDQNSQDVAHYLLNGLYPGILNVFPPCSIANFSFASDVSQADRVALAKNTRLYAKSESGGDYVFKTVYPINIYPLNITQVRVFLEQLYCLEIYFETLSVPVENLGLDDLLLNINGVSSETALELYCAIFSNPNYKVFFKVGEEKYQVPREYIVPCGLEEDETIVSAGNCMNYTFYLFREFFLFQSKFLFVRIRHLDALINKYHLSNISEFSLVFELNVKNDELRTKVNKLSVAINSTPIVNLFEYTTDSFRYDGTKNRYALIADVNNRNNIEIHTIKSLHMIDEVTKVDLEIPNYFYVSENAEINDLSDIFWIQSNTASIDDDIETNKNTYVSFIATNMNPSKVYADVVYAKTLCINKFDSREISINKKLLIDDSSGAGLVARMGMIPTKPERIDGNHCDIWDLLSQLSFNHISKNDANYFKIILLRMVSLYSGEHLISGKQFVENIDDIKFENYHKRIMYKGRACFAKALRMVVILRPDRDQNFYYLFFKVFNKYLQQIKSINSIIEIIIQIDQSTLVVS